MPTAHLSDIVGIHGEPPAQDAPASSPEHSEAQHAQRRVTGSSDIPLNAKGHEQAEAMAQRNKGLFTHIAAGPKRRAMETAQHVAAANPKAKVAVSGELRPWRLGGHEGKPSDEARPDVHKLMRNPDEIPPGKGEHSTDDGESFNEARSRAVGQLQKRLGEHKPGMRTLDVTSGRNIRIIDSYLRGGLRKDGSLDMGHMTKKDESKPGDLFFADVGRRRLNKVKVADKDGHYVARHGATDWSGDGGSGEGGS